MAKRIWVLGADDPEMTVIERLLTGAGEEVAYATTIGKRCHPGSAYQADSGERSADGPITTWAAFDHVVLVECGGPIKMQIGSWVDAQSGVDLGLAPQSGTEDWSPCWTRIDHHRPGDPGYGRPPEDFLAASSLGQVVAELARLGRLPDAWQRGHLATCEVGEFEYGLDGWSVAEQGPAGVRRVHPPDELLLVAAADHCLASAYAGRCWGIDPEALGRFRIAQRAAFQGRSVAAVWTDIQRAAEALLDARRVNLGCARCADFPDPVHHGLGLADHGCWGGQGPCTGYHRWIHIADLRGPLVPELPEAACQLGVAYLATVVERDGRTKIVIGGAGEGTVPGTAPIAQFLGAWAKAQGLVDLYGDPIRGLAGGYVVGGTA